MTTTPNDDDSGREVYPLVWFHCLECGTHCLGDNAVAEHRHWHTERGDGAPEWEVSE